MVLDSVTSCGIIILTFKALKMLEGLSFACIMQVFFKIYISLPFKYRNATNTVAAVSKPSPPLDINRTRSDCMYYSQTYAFV